MKRATWWPNSISTKRSTQGTAKLNPRANWSHSTELNLARLCVVTTEHQSIPKSPQGRRAQSSIWRAQSSRQAQSQCSESSRPPISINPVKSQGRYRGEIKAAELNLPIKRAQSSHQAQSSFRRAARLPSSISGRELKALTSRHQARELKVKSNLLSQGELKAKHRASIPLARELKAGRAQSSLREQQRC